MSDKKCGICGYRINPEVMKAAGDISERDWIDYNSNPVMSWCEHYKIWAADTSLCESWLSYEVYDAQMKKYGR